MRVGLVLGAGGFTGAAWESAALDALREATGWDPSMADYIVGTSAGSVVAASVAARVPLDVLSALAAGLEPENGQDTEYAAIAGDTDSGTRMRLRKAIPRLGPGSWRLAAAGVRRSSGVGAIAALSGLIPSGLLSNDPIRELIRRGAPRGWAHHRGLRIVACDYESGERVIFGEPGAPPTELHVAVAASCAIPGVYHPVRINGRRYVDGGVCSASNLDVLANRDLDAILCLNPTSAVGPVATSNPLDRLGVALGRLSSRRLAAEARDAMDAGVRVVLLEPPATDVAALGLSSMSRSRRAAAGEAARRWMAQQFDKLDVRRLADDLRAAAMSTSVGGAGEAAA
jgi:NTE family protein